VRHGALLLGLLGLLGCGRLEFVAMPEADARAPGHDEDGDGLEDAEDPCPHVPGDRADEDGDGVGDACDPHPTTGSDRLVVFSPLMPGDHPFDDLGAFEQQADGLHFAGDTANLGITRALGTTRIEIGFEIHALFGTGQRQVASGIARATEPYYFVELNENGPLH
jgi:hypothetical protein